VSIQDGARGVGDRLVVIVAVDEDGEDAGNRSLIGIAKPLEDRCEELHRGRGEAARARWFSALEADLTLSGCESREAVEEKENVGAGGAEIVGDRQGAGDGPQAHERRFVRRGHKHDRAGEALLLEAVIEKGTNLAAAFADEDDDVHVRRCIAGDFAEERTLADATAGEQADALTFAEGQEAIKDALAGAEDFGHGGTGHGGGWTGERGPFARGADGRAAVDGFGESIEDTAEECGTDGDADGAVEGLDFEAVRQALGLMEAHELGVGAFEADDFSENWFAIGAVDLAELTDGGVDARGEDAAGAMQFPDGPDTA
jgi:hypothetical protein